jgi:hypothetical protein
MRSACTLDARCLKLTLPYVIIWCCIIVTQHSLTCTLVFCLYKIKFKYTEFELYRTALHVVHVVDMCVVVNGITCCPHCRCVVPNDITYCPLCRYALYRTALHVVHTVDVLYETTLHVVHSVDMYCTKWHYMLSTL